MNCLGEEGHCNYQVTEDYPLRSMRQLERTAVKLARATNHIIFLKRCRTRVIVPKGLRVMLPVKGRRVQEIKTTAERSFVSDRLRFWKGRRSWLQKDLVVRREEMFARLPMQQAEENWSVVQSIRETEFQTSRLRQVRKFDSLVLEADGRQERFDFKDCVVNLSSGELSCAEVSVLSKGLKYVPAPKEVPNIDIISGVEEISRELDQEKAEELRHGVKRILMKAKKPQSNLEKEEWQAVKSLRNKRDSIVVLQADKGPKVVVMDSSDYM